MTGHYHIYVDLDRTIINTTQWLREIAEALAQLYPAQVTAEEFLAAQPRYMLRPKTNPTAPTYVLAAQLAALGLDAASVIEQLEQTPLADGPPPIPRRSTDATRAQPLWHGAGANLRRPHHATLQSPPMPSSACARGSAGWAGDHYYLAR